MCTAQWKMTLAPFVEGKSLVRSVVEANQHTANSDCFIMPLTSFQAEERRYNGVCKAPASSCFDIQHSDVFNKRNVEPTSREISSRPSSSASCDTDSSHSDESPSPSSPTEQFQLDESSESIAKPDRIVREYASMSQEQARRAKPREAEHSALVPLKSLISSQTAGHGDVDDAHIMPSGNSTVTRDSAMSVVPSSLVCLNLLETTTTTDEPEGGPQEWVRASLMRHVKVQLALQNIYILPTGSISSCSDSEFDDDDEEEEEEEEDDDDDDDASMSFDPASDASISAKGAARLTSSPCSTGSGNSDDSDSSDSGSSAESSMIRPPQDFHVIIPQYSQQVPSKFTFELDVETRIQNCLIRSDFGSAVDICRQELDQTHFLQYAHRAETLLRLAVLHMIMPYSASTAQSALCYSQDAYKLYRDIDRPLQAAEASMQTGMVFFWSSRPGMALKRWKHAMQVACIAMGKDHPLVAVLLNNIGVLHYDNGDYDASLRALTESLELQRTALACCAPANAEYTIHQLACTMGNMAFVYDDGKHLFSRAGALLQEAAALFGSVRTFAGDHMEATIAEYMENLASFSEKRSGIQQETATLLTATSTSSSSLTGFSSLDEDASLAANGSV